MINSRKVIAAVLTSPLLLAAPAQAEEVRLRANLLASCVLTLSTEGRMALSADATVLGSEQATGLPATMTVVAIGGTPTISFTAPALEAPTGAPSGSVTQIRYTSLGGSNQAYTANASSSSQVRLLDTFTVHGRVTNNLGFTAGEHIVRTTATCQQ